jgi:virginiamycin B lyase
VTPGGAVTVYRLPTTGAFPTGIVAASTARCGFTETRADKIGRITTAGGVTEFPLPGPIVAGADSGLWFAQRNTNQVLRLTTTARSPSGSRARRPTATRSCCSLAQRPPADGRAAAGALARMS